MAKQNRVRQITLERLRIVKAKSEAVIVSIDELNAALALPDVDERDCTELEILVDALTLQAADTQSALEQAHMDLSEWLFGNP